MDRSNVIYIKACLSVCTVVVYLTMHVQEFPPCVNNKEDGRVGRGSVFAPPSSPSHPPFPEHLSSQIVMQSNIQRSLRPIGSCILSTLSLFALLTFDIFTGLQFKCDTHADVLLARQPPFYGPGHANLVSLPIIVFLLLVSPSFFFPC